MTELNADKIWLISRTEHAGGNSYLHVQVRQYNRVRTRDPATMFSVAEQTASKYLGLNDPQQTTSGFHSPIAK
jgi:hypothetical protein